MLPALSAIAIAGETSATCGSIRYVRAPHQYTIASSAIPESHVVYASHLNQCSVAGSFSGPRRNFSL